MSSPVSGRYWKSGWALASARLSVSTFCAIAPVSPSPIAMRVTCTALWLRPRVANSSSMPSRKKVDRAHLARQALADDLHHLIELALRVQARGHDLGQAGKNLAGCGCGTHHLAGLFIPQRKCKSTYQPQTAWP